MVVVEVVVTCLGGVFLIMLVVNFVSIKAAFWLCCCCGWVGALSDRIFHQFYSFPFTYYPFIYQLSYLTP